MLTTVYDVEQSVWKTSFLSATDAASFRLALRSGRRPGAHLIDVAVYLLEDTFLSEQDKCNLRCVSKAFRYGSVGLPLWISRPWTPFRRQQYGFGKLHRDRSCCHDRISGYTMIHHIWRFWSAEERAHAVRQFPEWKQYVDLRIVACCRSVAILRRTRPTALPKAQERLDRHRAVLHSAALLRFDFQYGDFARWMSGEYTNRDRNWTAEFRHIEKQMQNQPPRDFPPAKLDLAFRIQSEGAPLRGQYETPLDSIFLRNQYDNHPAVAENTDVVHKKFAKEEWKSYHVHFLRFVFRFIPGLVINPIQWAWDKGKGRICIDCTNGPGDDAGSINTHIPSPKSGIELECPPVFYQTAFKRVLRHILRMRATRPNEPILVHANDIEAAFRRILYHPELAIGFAYVFEDFLVVPVGQVFGSRSAPSFYCLIADVRQALTASRPVDPPSSFHPLVYQCTYEIQDPSTLAQVPEDSHFPPLSPLELATVYNASYVDDEAVLGYVLDMPYCINSSVCSAFETFGEASNDRRGGCLQAAKWVSEVSEIFRFLGFIIDTHNLTVTWPLDKRQRLHKMLVEILQRPKPRFVSPKEMAQIIGIVRSASTVAPWGVFLSFNLENSLRLAARRKYSDNRKTWWTKSRVYLHHIAEATIRQLLETLLAPEGDPHWTRPIYLYIDRDPTHAVYSDASYMGIGGWSPDFKFYWRLTRQDLINHGFPMKLIDEWTTEPTANDDGSGLHINPLEYIGCLINLWLSLWLVREGGPRKGGYVLHLNSDNTTAVAWMSIAARTPDATLQGLARLERHRRRPKPAILTKTGVRELSGLRYLQMVPATDLSTMPPAFQLAAADCIRDFVEKDRGTVRAHNDKTFDSRASFFLEWTQDFGMSQQYIRTLDLPRIIVLLATFVRDVGLGDNLEGRTDMVASTIKMYMRSAHKALEVITGQTLDILDPFAAGKSRNYHPLIAQQIADRRKWDEPKPKKLPFTLEMFWALCDYIAQLPDPMAALLSRECAVYDWMRLGVFTGFRVGEYGQSQLRRGERFRKVPNEPHVPKSQRGKPLAFMMSDFVFFDDTYHHIVPYTKLWDYHRRGKVRLLEITWRYDKSPSNFSVRRYVATGHKVFDPIDAAVHIVQRALVLRVPQDEPMGVWSADGLKYRFVRDRDVSFVMRESVVMAYPDPMHYMRINMLKIVPHSNRVTAAVSLKKGGASNDDIAYRLRWNPKSVPTYLRDCFGTVNADLAKTLHGTMALAFA